MRLISLYITAFGGVCDYAFTFSEGISEICRPNGTGKSTLAAFIKVMLFGFGKDGKALEKNEERLYEPWQGGRFGGSLTFLHEGRLYRIERYFERVGKVKLREELTVIDEATGLPTDRFGEEVGRALFGVDGPSFMKTAYLSSRGISAGKTDDISAKLGGIEGEADDMAAFDRAVALLKDKRREIRTQNIQKNGQKQLDLAERELARVQEEILLAEAAGERLTLLTAELDKKRRDAEALDLTLASLREERSALDRRLGKLQETERRMTELRARLKEEEAKEAALSAVFGGSLPSGEELASLQREAAEAERLSRDAAPSPEASLPLPTDEELAALRGALRRRDELKTKLNSIEKTKSHTEGNGGHALRACFLLSTISVALGAVLLFFLMPLAIPLLALGACLLAVWGVLLLRAKQADRTESEKREAQDALLLDCRLAEEAAGDLLVRFRLARDAGMQEADALHTAALCARMERERAEKNKEAAKALEEHLSSVLSRYPALPAEGSYTRRIAALSALCEQLLAKRESILALKSEIVLLSGEAAREGKPSEGDAEKVAALLCEAEAARAALTAALAEGGREEEECKRLFDTLPALRDREAGCRSAVCELREKMETLDKTLAFLLSSRAAYEEAYLGGIRGHIKTYTDRLLTAKVGQTHLDLDLSLSFIKDGELHEAGYLSTGLLAIADICLRLALTDALYPKDPPPLLLDDPFATLDEENLAAALSLLRELGQERQIVYLTCHPSRTVKE